MDDPYIYPLGVYYDPKAAKRTRARLELAAAAERLDRYVHEQIEKDWRRRTAAYRVDRLVRVEERPELVVYPSEGLRAARGVVVGLMLVAGVLVVADVLRILWRNW